MSGVAFSSSAAPSNPGQSTVSLLCKGYFRTLVDGAIQMKCNELSALSPTPTFEQLQQLLDPREPVVLCLEAAFRGITLE